MKKFVCSFQGVGIYGDIEFLGMKLVFGRIYAQKCVKSRKIEQKIGSFNLRPGGGQN
jgi:hypothetical protein